MRAHNFIDKTGKQYGRLTVLRIMGKSRHGHIMWLCKCECGNETTVDSSFLSTGHTKSCGCITKKHGMSDHPYYATWANMINRCENDKTPCYPNYGGRGIKVCDRWHDIRLFLEDMGDRPKGKTLDRRDNDGDYCPENCYWANGIQQGNNKRDNHFVEYKGIRDTLAGWERRIGVSQKTIIWRLRNGWSEARAVNYGEST